MTTENGGAGDGAPDLEYVDDELERSHTERVEAVLRDFRDFSGRGAATIGAQLYDIARDAEGPITVGELVERWVAGAGGEQLGHVRRYAEELRRRKSPKFPRTEGNAREFSDVANARAALRGTLRWMVKMGTLRRLDGETHERGLWAALVEPGRPPRVNVGEPRRVGGTVQRQVGPYDDAERARREVEAERDRARARIAGLEGPLGRVDEAVVLRLGALALVSLAELVEEAAGIDARGPGTSAGRLLRRFAATGRRLELELVHDEVARELRRRADAGL